MEKPSASKSPRRTSVKARVAKTLGACLVAIATALSVTGAFGHGIPGLVRLTLGAVGGVLYGCGVPLYRVGKRATALLAHEVLAADARSPVLYLRSFKDDPVGAQAPETGVTTVFGLTATEEEQIAQVFSQLGPVIAIGRPGERLPELGAARLYVSDDEWKATVSELMADSRLVLYRASDTQNFHWEVEHGGKMMLPERIVFLIPAKSEYGQFCRMAERLLPTRFPELPRRRLRCGSLAGLVYFDANWEAHFVAPQAAWFRHRIRQPVVATLQLMVEPVFRQLGAPWSPPPVRWGVFAACASPFIVLIAAIILAILLR